MSGPIAQLAEQPRLSRDWFRVMYLYLLENQEDKSLYLGVTNNPRRRIREHNQETKHYTGKISGEWKLLGYKKFDTELEARKEEIRLKRSKNKKYILWYFRIKGR